MRNVLLRPRLLPSIFFQDYDNSVAKWRYLLYVCIEYSAVCKHMHSLIYLYVFPAFFIRQICMILAEEFAVTSYMMSDWVHMQPTLLSCVPISVNVALNMWMYDPRPPPFVGLESYPAMFWPALWPVASHLPFKSAAFSPVIWDTSLEACPPCFHLPFKPAAFSPVI